MHRAANKAIKKTTKPQKPKKVAKKTPKRTLTTTATPRQQQQQQQFQRPSQYQQQKQQFKPLFTQTKRTVVTEINSPEDAQQLFNTPNKLIVADFYANWCGPCKMLAPKLEKMSQDYPNVTFVKIDTDNFTSSDINGDFPEVSALPTIMFFKNNQSVDMVVGLNEPKIVAAVEKHQV